MSTYIDVTMSAGDRMEDEAMDNDKWLERAMSSASEYYAHVERGDVAMSGQVRRTIDDMVGRWIDWRGKSVWGWPACVVECAKSGRRSTAQGYLPDRHLTMDAVEAYRDILDAWSHGGCASKT